MNINDEAKRIKDRINACQSVDEVNKVADEEREAYKKLAAMKGGKPLARQIVNLKVFRINELTGYYKK